MDAIQRRPHSDRCGGKRISPRDGATVRAVHKNSGGHWRWRLVASNGQTVTFGDGELQPTLKRPTGRQERQGVRLRRGRRRRGIPTRALRLRAGAASFG
jgi:Domain of unknown function (DUF1508)